jgi:hypothetical protein
LTLVIKTPNVKSMTKMTKTLMKRRRMPALASLAVGRGR